MDDKSIHLTLSQDEALVLFELLARHEEADQLGVDGPAEQLALWRLHGQLEKVLVAPFEVDYADQLHQARERLQEQAGG